MTFGASNNTTSRDDTFFQVSYHTSLSTFPTDSELETDEQIRRFELLRLAFFVLKLRKLEQEEQEAREGQKKVISAEHSFRCNLLRHAIFQQVVTLTTLNAREQALQLINTCRK